MARKCKAGEEDGDNEEMVVEAEAAKARFAFRSETQRVTIEASLTDHTQLEPLHDAGQGHLNTNSRSTSRGSFLVMQTSSVGVSARLTFSHLQVENQSKLFRSSLNLSGT